VTPHRIGLVVPSSNVTVETEVPALLARHAGEPACVQMPSLELIGLAEEEFGLPVLSAATAAAYALLRHLGLPAILPGAGRLLATGALRRCGPLTTAPATGSPLQSRS
jgi:maleate cis-trans isomerase